MTYEVSALHGAGHCHCSMCRRAHGAAFATYVGVDAEEFRWTSGENLVTNFDAGRCFCCKCGSTLGGTKEGKINSVTLETVNGGPDVRPGLPRIRGFKGVVV